MRYNFTYLWPLCGQLWLDGMNHSSIQFSQKFYSEPLCASVHVSFFIVFEISHWKNNLIFIYLFVFTVVLAEVIPYLGYFISLVGAVSSTALALLFPPIVEMVLIWQNPKMSKFTFSKDILILVIGFLGCITGTYESISALIKEFQK